MNAQTANTGTQTWAIPLTIATGNSSLPEFLGCSLIDLLHEKFHVPLERFDFKLLRAEPESFEWQFNPYVKASSLLEEAKEQLLSRLHEEGFTTPGSDLMIVHPSPMSIKQTSRLTKLIDTFDDQSLIRKYLRTYATTGVMGLLIMEGFPPQKIKAGLSVYRRGVKGTWNQHQVALVRDYITTGVSDTAGLIIDELERKFPESAPGMARSLAGHLGITLGNFFPNKKLGVDFTPEAYGEQQFTVTDLKNMFDEVIETSAVMVDFLALVKTKLASKSLSFEDLYTPENGDIINIIDELEILSIVEDHLREDPLMAMIQRRVEQWLVSHNINSEVNVKELVEVADLHASVSSTHQLVEAYSTLFSDNTATNRVLEDTESLVLWDHLIDKYRLFFTLPEAMEVLISDGIKPQEAAKAICRSEAEYLTVSHLGEIHESLVTMPPAPALLRRPIGAPRLVFSV